MEAESSAELRLSPLVNEISSWQENILSFFRKLKAFNSGTISHRYLIMINTLYIKFNYRTWSFNTFLVRSNASCANACYTSCDFCMRSSFSSRRPLRWSRWARQLITHKHLFVSNRFSSTQFFFLMIKALGIVSFFFYKHNITVTFLCS